MAAVVSVACLVGQNSIRKERGRNNRKTVSHLKLLLVIIINNIYILELEEE
jgi:hypothetical protein